MSATRSTALERRELIDRIGHIGEPKAFHRRIGRVFGVALEDPTEVDQKIGLSRNPVEPSTDKRRASISNEES